MVVWPLKMVDLMMKRDVLTWAASRVQKQSIFYNVCYILCAWSDLCKYFVLHAVETLLY